MIKDELFKIGLLTICQRLHMAVTGSSDGIPVNDFRSMKEYLEEKVRNWEDGLPKSFQYDQAVRLLILETLNEVNALDESAMCTSKKL